MSLRCLLADSGESYCRRVGRFGNGDFGCQFDCRIGFACRLFALGR